MACYTEFGFEVSDSSMWSQKLWIDDPIKASGVHYIGEPSTISIEKFIDAIMTYSLKMVKSDFANILTTND